MSIDVIKESYCDICAEIILAIPEARELSDEDVRAKSRAETGMATFKTTYGSSVDVCKGCLDAGKHREDPSIIVPVQEAAA